MRARCGKAQRAARIKIAQAAVAAQAAPHKQLGERCREALEVLLGGRHVLQVCPSSSHHRPARAHQAPGLHSWHSCVMCTLLPREARFGGRHVLQGCGADGVARTCMPARH